MIAAVFRLELRRSRLLAGWLIVLVLAYGAFIGVFYPTIKQNLAAMDAYLKVFPKEFLAVFGMEGSLADPGVFYTTYIGMMLWPIVAAVAGIILATRTTAADTERGWIELPLAGQLPREAYLLAAIGAQSALLAVLAGATVTGVLTVGWLVGAGFDVGRFALAGVASWLFGCAIAAVTTLLAVVTLNRSVAAGVAAGVLIAMYLFRAVAQLQPDFAWLATISAFHYLYPTPIIDSGSVPVGDAMLFVGVSVAAWAAALWAFRRRDLIA